MKTINHLPKYPTCDFCVLRNGDSLMRPCGERAEWIFIGQDETFCEKHAHMLIRANPLYEGVIVHAHSTYFER